ncbi:unnamed protein product [Rotaria sp. Silwood2]|nr:unnamed protein product [Rotaria sp. Silwood2]
MDDSMINSILLPSSIHLENLEKLIKNLEKQTFNVDNFENILNNDNKQEIITKSYSSLSSSTIPIDDITDENFLIKSISLTNDATTTDHNHESFSMDSLSTQRDLFSNDDFKKQKISATNDQSLCNDQDSGFTWDDQYDTQTNYCMTFNIDKPEEIDSKLEKSSKFEQQTTNQKENSTYSDDNILSNVVNNMNDWSMQSDLNTLEQSINQSQQIHSQFNLPLSSDQQQNLNNNNSSGSSTSWRQMKQNQRTTTDIETRETRPLSPISLYKIFQQKSNMITSSSRSAFQLYRQQNDFLDSNHINKTVTEKSKLSQCYPTIDQAIQTSIQVDSSSNSQCQTTSVIESKCKSYDNLTVPFSISSLSIHKSLPDLSFISQYSKELPRSHTTSPLIRTSALSINVARTTSSPTLIQQLHKFNSFFTRANTQQQQQQRKSTSVVTTKLPESKQQIISSEQLRRPHISNLFNNSFATVTTNKPIVVENEKLNDSVVRNVSSSVSSTEMIPTFQSKILRPSLNIDTPQSARYHTTIRLPK